MPAYAVNCIHMSRAFCRSGSFLLALAAVAAPAVPKKTTYCALVQNPAAYDHDLVEITGFVSHGFEDFTMFDPGCGSWPDVWLEYGGLTKPLVVEEIQVPLLQDQVFTDFDRLVQRRPSSVVHATVVGRFFAGHKPSNPGGTALGGYGHMGCCSLLVVQQVFKVDGQDRTDLDFSAEPDQPDRHAGCFRTLTPPRPFGELIEGQERAELGQRSWAFDDSRRVATEALARLTKTPEESIAGIDQTRAAQGRLIYRWRPTVGKVGHKEWSKAWYMVVLSRPYWMSFYSKDPKKVAWGVMAVYEVGCK